MKSWVAYDGKHLWKVCKTQEEADEAAMMHSSAAVRGFKYGEGDKVQTNDGKYTVVRPAMSITGGFGYKVDGGRWDFIFEDDIKKVLD